jgi:hypothetical protein
MAPQTVISVSSNSIDHDFETDFAALLLKYAGPKLSLENQRRLLLLQDILKPDSLLIGQRLSTLRSSTAITYTSTPINSSKNTGKKRTGQRISMSEFRDKLGVAEGRDWHSFLVKIHTYSLILTLSGRYEHRRSDEIRYQVNWRKAARS